MKRTLWQPLTVGLTAMLLALPVYAENTQAPDAAAVDESPPQPVTKPQEARSVVTTEQAKDSVTEAAPKQNQSQVSISKSDLRKLVQSARVELSNSK